MFTKNGNRRVDEKTLAGLSDVAWTGSDFRLLGTIHLIWHMDLVQLRFPIDEIDGEKAE